MIDVRDASLIDFVPESIASDPEIIALSLALDPELRAVGAAIVEAIILPRIGELEDPVLDELAWAFRLNRLQIWDSATTAGKRALLRNIFAIRRRSGTRYAVRRVFDLVSVVGRVIEWFEEGGAPYTYRLRLFVDEVGITLAQLQQIKELTYRFAPTRCQLSEFAVESDRTAVAQVRAVSTVGLHVTIPFGG
jgi:phage tail P2-like protein